MRIVIVTIATLVLSAMALFTVKFWGKSQTYVEYKHPFYEAALKEPVIFVKSSFETLKADIESKENLFLEASITSDQILVLPLKKFEKPVRYYALKDIEADVLQVENLKTQLSPPRKIIFNLTENTMAEHEIFIDNLKKIKLENGDNFIVMSEYEAPIKALKELAPALLYGSTKPEILKMVAMQSMYLLEAVQIRADVIVHPLKIRNQNFYNEEFLLEMKKRFEKIIVGPINQTELEEARQLSPFGIIVNR